MVKLFRSGKFWLRFSVYGMIALASSVLIAQGFLHYLFDSRHIQAWADEAVRGSGRTVRFSSEIGRSWLPRPTVTLYDVAVSKPNSAASALHAKEMRIGLAWSNLWSDKAVIEKWVIKEADAQANQQPDGVWSFQDLWKTSGRAAQINRVVIENSRLNIGTPDAHYDTRNFNLNLSGESESSRTFTLNGTTHHNKHQPFRWHSTGRLNINGSEWLFPAVHVDATLPAGHETTSFAADADLTWQPKNHTLQARNLRLRADSSFHKLHLTAQSPALLWKKKHISVSEISAVFTARSSPESSWDGSLALSRISLRPTVATISELEFNGSHKNQTKQTTFNLSGPLIWQKDTLLESENFRLSTHQDSLKAAPRSRLVSQMEGRFALHNNKNWTLDLKGLFDRQNTEVSARYTAAGTDTPATLRATVGMQKLSLLPYWSDFQAKSGNLFPAFLNQTAMPQVHADIRIGSLNMPGLQMDDLQTVLYADNQRITLTNFRAGLYGGQTEGGISIANTDPPAYHLQQNARGVQIRPLVQDLLGYHRIGGIGDAVIDLTAKGHNRESLTKTLNGTLQLNVSQGAWLGLDISNVLQSLGNNTAVNNKNRDMQTPFRHFSLTSEIRNGVGTHENAELTSDIFNITSSGQTDFNAQTMSENMLIRNVKNSQAKPIPIKINGPVDNPSVTLDYNKLTSGLETPQEKQRALAETLREQWQWLNAPSQSASAP